MRVWAKCWLYVQMATGEPFGFTFNDDPAPPLMVQRIVDEEWKINLNAPPGKPFSSDYLAYRRERGLIAGTVGGMVATDAFIVVRIGEHDFRLPREAVIFRGAA
jgi:hypothetical protein